MLVDQPDPPSKFCRMVRFMECCNDISDLSVVGTRPLLERIPAPKEICGKMIDFDGLQLYSPIFQFFNLLLAIIAQPKKKERDDFQPGAFVLFIGRKKSYRP